jgi:hypothetical protein
MSALPPKADISQISAKRSGVQFSVEADSISGGRGAVEASHQGRISLRRRPIIMPNDQNNRPDFLQSAKGQVTLLIVAAIVVVFLSMVLHLL